MRNSTKYLFYHSPAAGEKFIKFRGDDCDVVLNGKAFVFRYQGKWYQFNSSPVYTNQRNSRNGDIFAEYTVTTISIRSQIEIVDGIPIINSIGLSEVDNAAWETCCFIYGTDICGTPNRIAKFKTFLHNKFIDDNH
jgi:hypothetical protein